MCSVSATVGDVSVSGIDGNDQPLIVESTSSGEYFLPSVFLFLSHCTVKVASVVCESTIYSL